MVTPLTRLLFLIFALSGFTGLIYESMWTHYLKLFLGSAAFAQSFVLAVFMGGMAIGAWIASRTNARTGNLLIRYAWIEAIIGVAALCFHEAYVVTTQASLNHVIPHLGSPERVESFKYALCALLTIPQAILLGMTFPLMSGAVIRRHPAHSGHHLAMLYFTNSMGAAAGVLFSGFLLLDLLGLPGTMRVAGILNLLIAGIVFCVAYKDSPAQVPATTTLVATPRSARLFLVAAFVTGAASFVYEIAWIRMLSLVLGASFQAFELMLSAFITGLALGGWWIRRRIDTLSDPMRTAGLIQVAMGLAALSTIFVYHYSFDWMVWSLNLLQRNDSAYPLFNMFSHAIAFAVMLPATFLAGMTLPLFTHALLRDGHGEKVIGQVYSANTLGAITGVLFTVHVLIPDMGLKLSLIVGTAMDIVLGGWLLRQSAHKFRRFHAFTAILIGLSVASMTARADFLSPVRLSSGVFRHGKLLGEDTQIIYYGDGKTASVAAQAVGSSVSIVTNGKSDALINMDSAQRPAPDEYTMTLLGAIPVLLKPDAKRFANIGFGSGLTAQVVLSHSAPTELHTIEIEPAMVAGARAFFPRVWRPFRDPRSKIFYEDAKSFLARHGKTYDVIISEPSNPWVNGVASLFTTEFYSEAKRYLAPGGLFVQWLHLYEFDDQLLGSILGSLGENFSDYEVYDSNGGDLIVIAVAQGKVPRPVSLPEKETEFLAELKRIHVTRAEAISSRIVGNKSVFKKLYAPIGAPTNSDFRPYVQLHSARSRFIRSSARAIHDFHRAPLPIAEMLGKVPTVYNNEAILSAANAEKVYSQFVAQSLARGIMDEADNLRFEHEIATIVLSLKRSGIFCGAQIPTDVINDLHAVAELTLSSLHPELNRRLWVERRWIKCTGSSPTTPHLQTRLDLYAAVANRDSERIYHLARNLLPALTDKENVSWKRFVLLAAMMAAKSTGNHQSARSLWITYGPLFYGNESPPLYARFMVDG